MSRSVGIEDAFASVLGSRRGLGRAREARIRNSHSWYRVVFLDAGMDDLKTVVPGRHAVALYDCSITPAGRFLALVAVEEILVCPDGEAITVGAGSSAHLLRSDTLDEMKRLIRRNRARRR